MSRTADPPGMQTGPRGPAFVMYRRVCFILSQNGYGGTDGWQWSVLANAFEEVVSEFLLLLGVRHHLAVHFDFDCEQVLDGAEYDCT